MEVLGGEVDLDVDGFEMVLEPEFTLVLVKVKGLGGAGALSEPIDSNSSSEKYKNLKPCLVPFLALGCDQGKN